MAERFNLNKTPPDSPSLPASSAAAAVTAPLDLNQTPPLDSPSPPTPPPSSPPSSSPPPTPPPAFNYSSPPPVTDNSILPSRTCRARAPRRPRCIWTSQEHGLVLLGVELYGTKWRDIPGMTKTPCQMNGHYRHFLRNQKEAKRTGVRGKKISDLPLPEYDLDELIRINPFFVERLKDNRCPFGSNRNLMLALRDRIHGNQGSEENGTEDGAETENEGDGGDQQES